MSNTLQQSVTQRAHWRDYYELTKPNVVYLMLLTSVIGMFMATPGSVPWQILLYGNIGIGLCAAAGAVINHLVDQRIDIIMARTHNRPVAQGRVSRSGAAIFATVLAITGMGILLTQINQLTAWLTFFSLVGYAGVYTLWLKRATPQNIVIGGLPGAAPPLLGWVAVTNSVDGHGLLLMLIVFAWTPPHFWALAIHRRDDYAKAGIPMLPVTHGIKYTAYHIMLYTLVLIAATLLPFATGMCGPLYLIGATVLGLIFLYWAIQIMREKPKAPMATFKFSILYLMMLYMIMLADHYLFPVVRRAGEVVL
ncbi:heme o synthase [Dasania sp. GY-MA-18]|uniref:Protoheme IX farnesyltransferase n=2 Tax=Spongiibacteraceae TaxID=1706375 RepID=A0A9J6RP02_9GAMM|nr:MULTISPECIES: heme o synthase [Dasania]MCR8923841.1 heme o synthase [Dasania sp. GY-MA-18]MCZ0866275.1 heme o synthase [Dasania phycosphaerae]MCZ0869999.1 heme o synthase [Dasania phycosphaerae]